ncbi:MAG TPA: ATP-binding protein [Puia sp.]|nr:ATP-binding protein [Puia sp.]
MNPESLPIRVLIVDDDQEDFSITSQYIKKIRGKEFIIDWSYNYKEAYDAILESRYDIYFIDYYLGAKTGLDLMKEVLQFSCEQPLILLTGMGNQKIDQEAMVAGAFDYLVKVELNTEKLERCIRYSLDRAGTLKTLRSNERKFRSIFEKSKDAVFLTDPALVFKDVNYSTTNMLGHAKEELLLLSLDQFIGNPDQPEKIRQLLLSEGDVEDMEIELINRKGEKLQVILSLSMEMDEADNLYIQGIIHDISNLKQAEKATLQAEKLGAANRLVRALAHEVRNPLNNINLSIDQLMQEGLEESAGVYLDIIGRNSRRINDLITELLMSSSMPGENQREKKALQTILDESIATIIDRITLKKVSWKVVYPNEPAYILADPMKLKIAFTNIIINAIEAMHDNRGELNISVTSQNGHHLVSIKDNGTGISKETLPHLFEPYFTFKRNGLGLGLATTLNIIQSHKASIDVQTSENQGSNFILKFERA